MKKLTYFLVSCFLILGACKKKESSQNNSASQANGTWNIAMYDGIALTAPNSGSLIMSNGSADYSLTFGATNTEKCTYTFGANNSTVVFTKVSGTASTLSGGGTWTVNALNANKFYITSQFGLTINMTR